MGTHLAAGRHLPDERMVAAICGASEGGILWFDSAHNYARGQAEIALSQALSLPSFRAPLPKVQTKIGFPDIDLGLDRVAAQRVLRERYPALDGPVSPFLERGGHCLDVRFLRAALEASLRRLAPVKPHRVLVHNPETQLCGDNRSQVLARLLDAFELLEACTQTGALGGYGLATWQGLCVPPEHPQHIPLAHLCSLMQASSSVYSGFKTVMLPLNVAMRDAAEVPTQQVGRCLMPAIRAAYELGLEIQISSPLAQGSGTRETHGRPSLVRILEEPLVSTVFVTMWSPAHLAENLDRARDHGPPC